MNSMEVSTTVRWEFGSEFHWFAYQPTTPEPTPWGRKGELFMCARDALRALIHDGMANRGWQRLWVPGYFCQEVLISLASTGIELVIYPDDPQESSPSLRGSGMGSGDVVFIVNFFGLRSELPRGLADLGGIETIEDHSHDPWSAWAWSSDATWCVCSLRKTLPIPDGGVLWSPRGRPLPSAWGVTPEQRDASSRKLAAMVLKGLYLSGHDVDKIAFRELSIAGENSLAGDDAAGISEFAGSLLPTFPASSWRAVRLTNHQVLSESLSGVPWVTVLQPGDPLKTCPFSGILVFDSADRREHVRQNLIRSDAYPAILWPLHEPVVPGVENRHRELSRRMMSIPCDMRYGESDMLRVADLIKSFGEQYHP
jgi:hypothetical protein